MGREEPFAASQARHVDPRAVHDVGQADLHLLANLALGFKDDERDYGVAAAMLKTLGVASIQLMTNNPDKVRQLEAHGVLVQRRLPHIVEPNGHNRAYLETKARRGGHLLELTEDPHEPRP